MQLPGERMYPSAPSPLWTNAMDTALLGSM
jgi:hypothetical protein